MYAIHPTKMNRGQVCIKEHVNGYEISIAFDDSCGCLSECSRGDIRVYNAADEDISRKIINESVIMATIENLSTVYEWCKTH